MVSVGLATVVEERPVAGVQLYVYGPPPVAAGVPPRVTVLPAHPFTGLPALAEHCAETLPALANAAKTMHKEYAAIRWKVKETEIEAECSTLVALRT